MTASRAASIAVANRLRQQGHGTLVVLSSVAGERVRKANFVYGAIPGDRVRAGGGLRARRAEEHGRPGLHERRPGVHHAVLLGDPPFQGLGRQPGDMRCGDHVVQREQRIACARRLVHEYIESGGAQGSAAQGRQQGGLVDQTSPRGVHQDRTAAHTGDALGIVTPK